MDTVTGFSAISLLVLTPLGLGKHIKPQAIGVCIVGIMMSFMYPKGILSKYKITSRDLAMTDFFLHFLPMIAALSIRGAPDPTLSIMLSMAIAGMSIGFDPWEAYPGVPTCFFSLFVVILVVASYRLE
jgi:hypothetical protein